MTDRQIYRPALVYGGKHRRPQDMSLNIALVFAGKSETVEAAGGILRAAEDGCLVVEGDPAPPILHATEPNGRMSLRRHVVVSTPPGADFTLVEFNYTHHMAPALSMMLPGARIVSFRSNYENSQVFFHEMAVYAGGERLRLVEVDRGNRKVGFAFTEEGRLQEFERPETYTQRSILKRLDRQGLLEMASRLGLDVERALWRRELETPVHLIGVEDMGTLHSAELAGDRTARFQSAHDKAVALGIGQGETAIDQLRDHADYMEHIKVLIAFGNRFHAAIDRAKPHPAKVWKAYRKWMSAPDCPDDFIPCYGSYLTSGVDRSLEPTAYAELKREDRLWQEAHEWERRITHTVIDQFDDKGHELAELAAAVPNSVKKLRDGAYPNIETAVRQECANVFQRIGIRFDPQGPVLSLKDATKSMAKCLVDDVGSWTDELNAEVTLDMRIKETTWIDSAYLERLRRLPETD